MLNTYMSTSQDTVPRNDPSPCAQVITGLRTQHLVTGGTGTNLAGPAHDQRNANAALERGALGSAQWPHIGSIGEASIIGHKNNQ